MNPLRRSIYIHFAHHKNAQSDAGVGTIYVRSVLGQGHMSIRIGPFFKDGKDEPVEGDECDICYELMTPEDFIISQPCRHAEHLSCMKRTIALKDTCPVCRKHVTNANEYTEAAETFDNVLEKCRRYKRDKTRLCVVTTRDPDDNHRDTYVGLGKIVAIYTQQPDLPDEVSDIQVKFEGTMWKNYNNNSELISALTVFSTEYNTRTAFYVGDGEINSALANNHIVLQPDAE